jgi:enamine deaminase RidA (YjgF/YER057c/UK114 family)
MSQVENRLADMGITIGQAAAPAAKYVPFVISGNLIYVSGQIPMEDGQLKFQGKVGADMDRETATEAARLCAINIIAQLKAAVGDLDRITRIVRLGGFVNSTPDFGDQPEVINGASNLMFDAFGEAVGAHSRAAVSAAALPRGVAVEIDAIAEFA